jgi:exonuclease VII small subunit
MNKTIAELEKLTQSIQAEKRIDQALDTFINGAQLVKTVLKELDQAEGKVYEVIDDVEKIMEE